MKKICLLFAFVVFLQNSRAQKNIEGTWEGKLPVGATALRLVVHIKNENNSYTATMDSPDQGAKGIPVSSVKIKDDSLFLEVAAVGGKVYGKLTSDTAFNGEFFQGLSVPLQLKKLTAGETIVQRIRPQTPKPPFPYKSKDIVYYNKDKSIQYGATITMPEGKGPFPALILLTGSGQQNRNEEIMEHKPFAVLADYLTRQGYLVLRVDDRGVGQTTGDVKSATTKDFAEDAIVGLDYLKSLPETDETKLGLLGHSEGGMIAQLIAAQRNDIAFVILLAALGQQVIDLMTEQNKAILLSSGLSKEVVETYDSLYKSLATAITVATSDSAAKTAALQVVDKWMQQAPKQTVVMTTGITDENSKQKFINAFVTPMRLPWFHYFLQYNPAVYVQKIKAKVLALNGEKDIQVIAQPNLTALKAALQKSRSSAYDVIELKGLNHLFQHCTKCTVAEYGELEETIAPEALETIGSWLHKNVK